MKRKRREKTNTMIMNIKSDLVDAKPKDAKEKSARIQYVRKKERAISTLDQRSLEQRNSEITIVDLTS